MPPLTVLYSRPHLILIPPLEAYTVADAYPWTVKFPPGNYAPTINNSYRLFLFLSSQRIDLFIGFALPGLAANPSSSREFMLLPQMHPIIFEINKR